MTRFIFSREGTFRWQGIGADGKLLSGEIASRSRSLAQNSLIRHNIRLLSLRKIRSQGGKRVLTATEKMIFFSQLASMLAAGIPLLNATSLSCQQEEASALALIHAGLRDEMLAGNGLAAGLRRFPRQFDALTCHLVQTGEQTGTLDILLQRIASHLQHLSALKRKLMRACLYPAITLVVASGITLFLLAVMIPRFASLFQEMHVPLPAFTRGVLLIGEGLSHWLLPSFLVFTTGLWLIYCCRHLPLCAKALDSLWLRLPITGRILQKIILARTLRTLATVLSSGLPMTEALGMTAPATGNLCYEAALQRLKQAITTGQSLSAAMSMEARFPGTLLQMTRAGETSGTLVRMLEKSAELYEASSDHAAHLVSQFLEPLIMAILGVLIGSLVIAMYLPVFRLGNVI